MTKRSTIFIVLVALVLLVGCRSSDEEISPDPTATGGPVTGVAPVETVEVVISETTPVQVSLVVDGSLPDGCTAIDQIDQVQTAADFQVTISTIQATDGTCVSEAQPFTEVVVLAVEGQAAGIYTVDVNGVGATFTLQEANVVDEGNAVLSGRVWHDLCAVGPGDGQVDVTPSDGCEPIGDYYQANGVLEADEPGLGGITVNLGQGACPSAGLATTITDGEGVFLFSGLTAGTYCIFVDTQEEQNESSLLPGLWTYPPGGEGFITVEITPGENRSDLNFGWDYQYLPAPETVAGSCNDSALFIQDVTIPDDTILSPGETFTKTWQLRNNGTCTWDTGYDLVFFAGEQMGGADVVPLPSSVGPEETIDLTVALVAPAEPGTYLSEWMLRNAGGILFGIGDEADTAFWVQIVVAN